MIEFENQPVRSQFPSLDAKVYGNPLVYLDSGATTLKPKFVVEGLTEFYLYKASNVHRGAHYLSDVATTEFENARERVRGFLGATTAEEIVFTRGTTESINLVANILKGTKITAGDEILVSEMEHHSNIVPWQMVAEAVGAQVKFVPITSEGKLDLSQYKELLTAKTKVVSLTHCSNVLGTFNPLKEMFVMAKEVGALTVADGAQAVSVMPVDVVDLGCDFYCFSGHKIFGPFGIGVLYGRKELLNALPPYQGGGSMISKVDKSHSTYLSSPQRYEAGTPHISGAVGLSRAIEFVQTIGFDEIHEHEMKLLAMAHEGLKAVKNLTIYGDNDSKSSIVSFNIKGAHHSDLAVLLDRQGVAVRTGHHCCQPLMNVLGVPGTVRACFSIYNTEEDVKCLLTSLEKAVGLM